MNGPKVTRAQVIRATEAFDAEFAELDAEVAALDFSELDVPLPSELELDHLDESLDIYLGEQVLHVGAAPAGAIPIGPEFSINWSHALQAFAKPLIRWVSLKQIPEEVRVQLEGHPLTELQLVTIVDPCIATPGEYVVVGLMTGNQLMFKGDRIGPLRSLVLVASSVIDLSPNS